MLFKNKLQGVQLCKASKPSSQNRFRSDGLKPDIIDAPRCVDNVGNPDVERKFQNKMCGGLNGFPQSLIPASAYFFSIVCINDLDFGSA